MNTDPWKKFEHDYDNAPFPWGAVVLLAIAVGALVVALVGCVS